MTWLLAEGAAVIVMGWIAWYTTRRHPENWEMIKRALRDHDG